MPFLYFFLEIFLNRAGEVDIGKDDITRWILLTNFEINKFPFSLKLLTWMNMGWLLISVGGLMCDCIIRGQCKIHISTQSILIYHLWVQGLSSKRQMPPYCKLKWPKKCKRNNLHFVAFWGTFKHFPIKNWPKQTIFDILAFSTIFCLIKSERSGNTV